jgi:hypothetical protein
MEKAFTPNNFWARWIPAVVMMIVIFLFSSIPGRDMPDFGIFDLLVKKLGHMLGYALLASAYYIGLRDRARMPLLLAWALAVGYAITDELHQYFVPGRSAWAFDIMIDAIGAAAGLVVFPRIFRSLTKL